MDKPFLGFTPPPAQRSDIVLLDARIKQLEFKIDLLQGKIEELILLVNRQSKDGSRIKLDY